jgi:uncharacterized protein (TIGR03437 family)
LLATGTAEVEFKSEADLEDVEVWFTPSLDPMKATPSSFAKLEKGTTYKITLELTPKPERTLGGTLHLQSGNASSRSYALPLPISVKFRPGDAEQEDATIGGVTSSADYRGGSVVPGQTVSVFGSGLGPEKLQGPQQDRNGRVSNYLGDTQVLFNGVAAPLLAVSATQVNAVVPQSVASDPTAEVVVTYKAKVSRPLTLPVEPAAPAFYTLDASGRGQAAALNQDGSLNSASSRARRGTAVVLFGSGFGEWKEPLPDGAVVGSALPSPKAAVSVTISGVAARVLYAGGAPGLVSGVVQINAEVPTEVTPGDKVTVVVNVGGKSSRTDVTIAVE